MESLNLYLILPFVGFATNAILGIYIFYANPNNSLNRAYFFLTLCFAFWGLGDFLTKVVFNSYWGFIIYNATVASTCFMAPSYLRFMMLYAGESSREIKIAARKLSYFWLYLPAVFFIWMWWFTDLIEVRRLSLAKYVGYFREAGPLYWVPLAWIFIYCIIGIFFCWRLYYKTTHWQEKKQAWLLIFGSVFTLAFGMFTDGILPLFGIAFVTEGTVVASIVLVSTSAYAVLRYGFLSITPQLAAETIISTIPDLLMVLDENLNISLINSRVADVLGYSREELLNRPVEDILVGSQEEEVTQNLKKISLENHEIELITKNQEKIPANINSSLLKEGDKILGIVTIIRDIRPTKAFISQLETAKNSLEEHNKELVDLNQKLEQKYQEIGWMNRLMAGRESKMADLKRENDELEEKIKKRGNVA